MALAAEAQLGIQLITRHRGPRIAVAVAGVAALLAVAGDAWTMPAGGGVARHLALAVGLSAGMAAACGARLLAPGAALHSARYAAIAPASAVTGRLLGATGLLATPALGLMVLLLPPHASWFHAGAVLASVMTATGVSMATAPFTGAVVSGLVWVAVAMAVALHPFPALQSPWAPLALTVAAGAALVVAARAVAHGSARSAGP